MSKLSRDKGARGERQFANDFEDLTGIKLRRNLTQYQAKGNCDLVPDPNQSLDAVMLVQGYAFEIKNYSHVTPSLLRKFWEQTVDQAKGVNKRPVLVVKQSRQPWAIYVSGGDYYPLESILGTVSMSLELFAAKVVNGEKM